MEKDLLTLSEAACEVGCRPRDISDAIYLRELDAKQFLTLGNRRFVPRQMLGAIREVLAAKGKLKPELAR